ncbi:MAG: S8 family serine peptidase [Chitinophagaceae bacterium]
MNKLISLMFCLIVFSNLGAQNNSKTPQNWHLLSPAKDNWHGINLNGAYSFLKQKNSVSQSVIVAIIGTSGIDASHEDLKGKIWTNKKEIPNNKIDDDNNGYVDDVLGWNFLGKKNGETFDLTNTEKARMYQRFNSKYGDKSIDSNKLMSQEKYEYRNWLPLREEYKQLKFDFEVYKRMHQKIEKSAKALSNVMKVKDFTLEMLAKYEPTTEEGKKDKKNFIDFAKSLNITKKETSAEILESFQNYIDENFKSKMDVFEQEDLRSKLIGDTEYDLEDRKYGNNVIDNPIGEITVSAGIIAANRENKIGINGIANNVLVMPIVAVPSVGDEYDKDIALAIFYAVDNGAKVILMGFGKNYSLHKDLVDNALLYAAQKDVLIVHSVGSDGKEIAGSYYPSLTTINGNKVVPNFIRVAASSDPKLGENNSIIAPFTSYGKDNVHVFAPGENIYTTLSSLIKMYSEVSSSAISASVVCGLAALIRSNFPKLTAIQVKQIIEQTVYKPNPTLVKLDKDGSQKVVDIKALCTSGGIIDAEAAVKKAFAISTKK